MEELFVSVLNMSLTASYVILFVMLVRLVLKKAPKVISYMLWGVVAFRLLCPFSFESMFSLLPNNTSPIPRDIAYQPNPQINSGIDSIDTVVNKVMPTPNVGASVNPMQIYMQIGSYIWIVGIAAMLVYSVISILLLKKQLKNAKHIEQNIYEATNLKTPFVLGFFSPKIFIPARLSTEERKYIIWHEQAHIQRFDHVVKPFGFLVLSIHWFNPLVWVAFLLMSTDMELSCDEKVIREIGSEIKKAYSYSLLSLGSGHRILNGSPLAFGEGNVRGRIKNVLNYRKPAFWVIVVSVIACIAVGIGLISNPNKGVYLLRSSIYSGDLRSNKIVSVTLNGLRNENQAATATITMQDGNLGWGQLVDFLESVMVNKKEINRSRAGSRDATYQIIFNRQIGEYIEPIEINFSSDFTKVWINDVLTKPSYSYRVINPATVSEYITAFFISLDPEIQSVPSDQPLTFSSDETDLIKLGTVAFNIYMELLMSEKTLIDERIAFYKLNDISVLDGDINEFYVSVDYDFATDNNNYDSPGSRTKGKDYLEIRVQHAYEDVYVIKGVSTGSIAQGLEPIAPEWSSQQSIGADMAELDYASDDIVIFHGYFGLYVYDLNSTQIIRSLDLKPLNCDKTQGDDYCEVTVSMDGNTVHLHSMSSQNMYVYTVSNHTLQKTTYQLMKDSFSSQFIPIEEAINLQAGSYSYNAVRFDTNEYGLLHTYDWTLGTLFYRRGDTMYSLFDLKE